jgi:hypothetical protein
MMPAVIEPCFATLNSCWIRFDDVTNCFCCEAGGGERRGICANQRFGAAELFRELVHPINA